MGTSEFEDSRQQTVIVPKSYQFTTAPYSISRSEKHATCLACINPNGLFCKPQYCVQRSSFDSEIFNYLNPNEVQIVHTESGYVNTESFTYWLYSSFLPELHKLRELHSYSGKAILIMDNCSSHINAIKNINLIEENLIVHFLIPHSSHLTQPLDLNIFGPTKQFMSNYHYIDNISKQSNQIIKIQTSLRQATTQFHCRAAFRSIGIYANTQFFTNYIKLYASFDFSLITRIKEYTLSHILQLVKSDLQLTRIQFEIYSKYIKNTEKASTTNRRLPLPCFGKSHTKKSNSNANDIDE